MAALVCIISTAVTGIAVLVYIISVVVTGLGNLISITVAGRAWEFVVIDCCDVTKEVLYCCSRGRGVGKGLGLGWDMWLWATRWLG